MYKFADFHCDTLLNIYFRDLDFGQVNLSGHLDLPRLREANHVFQCFAVFADPKFGQEAALRQTLGLIEAAREKIFSLSEITWVKRATDLEGANLAGLLSIEGADFLGTDLFLLELVHHLGVRLITLTWNGRNSIADGVGVGENCGGLTTFGVDAVKKMQALNLIVDVSHLGEKGFWDLARITAKPFVATHSNAWEVCNHPRNLKDEQIREIARNNGLIGMNLCPSFIAAEPEERTLATVVKHIRHLADLVGTSAICLGCDLDGIKALPTGMKDVRDVVGIADLLGEAGFSRAEIEGICSSNLLRFLRNNLE